MTQDWQPIETAPKDTKARLVWVPEIQCIFCVAWQRDSEYPWSGKWTVFGAGRHDAIRRPTHWMPLPEPPEAK